MKLLQGQTDVEGAGVQECTAVVMFSTKVQRTGELGTRSPCHWSEGRNTGGDGIGRGGMFGTDTGGGLATSYVSCYSCAVTAASVVLMLFSEMFCLSVSSWRWCCRYLKASATPWEVFEGNNIWRVEFLEGWV